MISLLNYNIPFRKREDLPKPTYCITREKRERNEGSCKRITTPHITIFSVKVKTRTLAHRTVTMAVQIIATGGMNLRINDWDEVNILGSCNDIIITSWYCERKGQTGSSYPDSKFWCFIRARYETRLSDSCFLLDQVQAMISAPLHISLQFNIFLTTSLSTIRERGN